jgi:arylsulfatase A-like enzyme
MIGKWHMGGHNASPRPGFDHWVSFPGQGHYYPRGFDGKPPILNVDGVEVEQQGYITDELTDYAVDWLEETTSQNKAPFMLYLGHKAVHAFFEPAERHLGAYNDVEIEDVTPSLEEMKKEPLWVQNQRNSWHGADYPYHSKLSLQEYRRDYYETLSAVDDSLGRLMTWLETNDLADNTDIVFLSDNGFMFGEHGLIDKRNAYEESMRIPLMVWGPNLKRVGATETSSVSMLDIAPTLLDLAHANAEEILPGRSLVPFFSGDVPDWNDDVVYEYFWEFNYPQTPSQFALRDGRWKYIRLHGVWDTDALYDLENDPKEQNNLINSPEHLEIRLELARRLHDALQQENGRANIPFTYKYNQGAVFRSESGADAGGFPSRWVKGENAPDRLEHFLEDGPQKEKILPKLTEGFEENERQIRSR